MLLYSEFIKLFHHSSVLGTTQLNIALGKPAFMISPFWDNRNASFGNDGDVSTIFQTGVGSASWWAIDFGQERARVTRVRVTNRLDIRYRCKGIG